tara:strand:- start:3499 stop:6402 length:2904 start_codon:yes stop_codon:yes gene_type:complete
MSFGFEKIRSQKISSLSTEVEEYRHTSGAKHFHFSNDYSENVFMVAFRTIPDDSTGVAHILEHTALCGSEKYPVRDPFFSMLRRSLNTFMNAFTSSDFTAYPFASQNEQDYFNLLEVYLDAVFFCNLDPLDFAQEGHRLEFEKPSDPDSPLIQKGVVYNEMKGATSSPVSILYQGVQEALYPESTYHHNSGGDPAIIPQLTYEQLKGFHRSHYHPSNAVFMTFGNIAAEKQQEKFSKLALSKITSVLEAEIKVFEETRYQRPQKKIFEYPLDDDNTADKTHIVLGWLLGKNTDVKSLLRCHLLSGVLLDTGASPLRLALEQSDLSSSASPLCGLEEDHMEMNFVCGVEGSNPDSADEVERLILNVLKDICSEGIDSESLESALYQLELSQREIGGDGWPFGLQIIFSCMPAAIHRGDPIELLDIESALVDLREEIKDQDFIKKLIRDLLLDNPHRVRVVMQPNRELGECLVQDEKKRLAKLKQALSVEQKKEIVDLADRLKARQSLVENLDVLPKVTRKDIPDRKNFPHVSQKEYGEYFLTAAAASTNSICYHQVINPVPLLGAERLRLLPILSNILSELGSGGRLYIETQRLQHRVCGGISAFASFRGTPADCDSPLGYLTISSKTLDRYSSDMMKVVQETVNEVRFDERDRFKELINQMYVGKLNSITSNGHQLAMMAASARLRPSARINELGSGISGILNLKQLVKKVESDIEVKAILGELSDLYALVNSTKPHLLLVAGEEKVKDVENDLVRLWSKHSSFTNAFSENLLTDSPSNIAYVISAKVNFCAAAYSTVSENHPDSPALSVLGSVLRNGFLHSEIREKGGAYGGGAMHDAANGIFRFYSYRDPRLMETFDDFQKSLAWLASEGVSESSLEEAIIGVLGSVDAPGSPAGEIKQAYHQHLFGNSAEKREEKRKKLLEVTAEDLLRVAELYLSPEPALAALVSENSAKGLSSEFLKINVNA